MLKQSVHGLCSLLPEGKESIFAYLYLQFPWFAGLLGQEKNVTRGSHSVINILYHLQLLRVHPLQQKHLHFAHRKGTLTNQAEHRLININLNLFLGNYGFSFRLLVTD